jgi:hypothetical protein
MRRRSRRFNERGATLAIIAVSMLPMLVMILRRER